MRSACLTRTSIAPAYQRGPCAATPPDGAPRVAAAVAAAAPGASAMDAGDSGSDQAGQAAVALYA
ncbi:hypothetical protein BE17_39520 [Sorangium cellulosum]|uniref:Uncharacterized protein n=1 Tax=Sorangium cellulosum TaxID=56 RepID=A0A150RYY5_SORCE|nr:hypothetical protein BE17_39520 [Sorangium cellulosum]